MSELYQTEAQRNTTTRTTNPPGLSEKHYQMLEAESGIAREVWQANGASTVTRSSQLPKCYSRRQRSRAPGMLFTVHHFDGTRSTIFRPDKPREDSPGHKYEQECKKLGGAGNVLGVHPWQRHLWKRRDVPVWIVEGQKKQLSVVSALWRAGLRDTVLVVSVSGTWNWKSGEPIPHLLALPLEGRKVRVWYDSDLTVKWQVRQAAAALCRHLDASGADVEVVIAPAMPDGSKRGADDHLASGGTLAEAAEWCERWTPKTFSGEAMMQRSPKLREAVEAACALLWERPPGGAGDATDHKIRRALIQLAPERGSVVEGGAGLFIDASYREVTERVAASSRTVYKGVKRMEADGVLRRGERKTGRRAAGLILLFDARASVRHYGTDSRLTQQRPEFREALYTRVLHLRSPALRASSPGWKPSKKRIAQARKTGATLPAPRPAVWRPGPRVGQALDAHDACDRAGYVPTAAEIAAALGIKRVRDYRRRTGAQLRKLRLVDESGSLARGWPQALDLIREHGDEQEQGRRVREQHAEAREKWRERQREKYRARHRQPKPREQYPRAEAVPGPERVNRLVRHGMRRDFAERESYPAMRRFHIEQAIARLFAERPEYRSRRVGQVVCKLPGYLAPDFPRGPDGLPKDREVEALLDGAAA